MLNIRFIFKMLGAMFVIETLFMLMALGVALFYEGSDIRPFAYSCAILFGVGLTLLLVGWNANEHNAGRREGMLIVTLTWALLSFFGALPFYIGGYIDTMAGAYFETMSGFTTTGSSVVPDVEALPRGILFWRSLTQWQGGMGVIVFAVALLPMMGEGASQMFNAESTGITHERFRPRITQVAKRLWGIYVFLTALLVLLLWLGPMNLFDAINHAMTAIATGGFSTKNASIAYWNSPYIEYTLSLFMCIGATNMTLVYFFLNGKFSKLYKDEEVRWFYAIVLIATLITAIWIYANGMVDGIEAAFRNALFVVTTLISTTGYATANYIPWGPFFWMIALLLMVICGCAGSTCGGFKTGRFAILMKHLLNAFKAQTHPHAILPVRFNQQAVPMDVVNRILAFTVVYIALIVVTCLLLMMDGVAFDEAIGAAVTCMGNVGPGLGTCGAAGNFSAYSPESQWLLSFIMMTGRLEIFTVLTILLPGFWKQ